MTCQQIQYVYQIVSVLACDVHSSVDCSNVYQVPFQVVGYLSSLVADPKG